MTTILYERTVDGVGIVTLNRPENLNALDVEAKGRLGDVWNEAANDPSVKALLLHGAGPRAFCAGSDINEVRHTGKMVDTDVLVRSIPNAGIALDKPVVAALHGHCVGMGMTLAIHCDFRIGGHDVSISYPEVNHGMISAISALRLPELIGEEMALRMLLLGERFDAAASLAAGLVGSIAEDPYAEAMALASRLAAKPPVAVRAHKRLAGFRKRRLAELERDEVIAVRAWVESFDDFKQGAQRFVSRTRKGTSV